MSLSKARIIFLCVLMIFLFSGFAYGVYTVKINNVDKNFDYRRQITIQLSQVQGGPHSNFPMLFDSTTTAGLPADLKHVGEPTPGKVENINGWDIVFAMTENQEILKHEIEEYVPSSGEYIAWIKIASLSGITQFYMYYGSTQVSTDSQHVNDVWDANYVGVWHLKEQGAGTADEYKDSTQYTNHGQGGLGDSNFCPSRISDGQIGYGQSFSITPDSNSSGDDEGDVIDVGNSTDDPELDITGKEITIEFWMRYTSATHPFMGPLNHKGWSNGYRLVMNENSQEIRIHLPGSSHNLSSNYTLTTNDWHHVVAAYEGVTDQLLRIYIDGTQRNSTGKSDNILSASPEEGVWIGHGDQPWDKGWSYPWDGDLDEVRISDSERDGDWIKTEYNNQWDPGAFYSVSAEETIVKLSYFIAKPLNSRVVLQWATEIELDNEGFNILRSQEEQGGYVKINPYLIPARGIAGFGAEYSFTDYDVENGVIYYYLLEDIDFYGKGTLHGPISVTPNDIILIWPRDWETFFLSSSLFSWASSGEFSFKVDVSTNPSFSDSETLTFPEEGWTSSISIWLRPEEWEIILRMARSSGGHLFWRVRARSQDGRVVCTDWKRFIVENNRLPENN